MRRDPFICSPVMRSLLMTRLASRFGAANIFVATVRVNPRGAVSRGAQCVQRGQTLSPVVNAIPIYPPSPARTACSRRPSHSFAPSDPVCDPERREHTKHMLRLRREGQITGKQVPEIIPAQLSRWQQFVPDAAGTISCGLSERAWSVVSRLARCGCRTRGRGESGDQKARSEVH